MSHFIKKEKGLIVVSFTSILILLFSVYVISSTISTIPIPAFAQQDFSEFSSKCDELRDVPEWGADDPHKNYCKVTTPEGECEGGGCIIECAETNLGEWCIFFIPYCGIDTGLVPDPGNPGSCIDKVFCDPGEGRDFRGNCVPGEVSCPEGEVYGYKVGTSEDCVPFNCPEGTYRSASGLCRENNPTLPWDTKLGVYGKKFWRYATGCGNYDDFGKHIRDDPGAELMYDIWNWGGITESFEQPYDCALQVDGAGGSRG